MTLEDFLLWYEGFIAGVSDMGLTQKQWTALKEKIASINKPIPSIFFPGIRQYPVIEPLPYNPPITLPHLPRYTPPRDYIWCNIGTPNASDCAGTLKDTPTVH